MKTKRMKRQALFTYDRKESYWINADKRVIDLDELNKTHEQVVTGHLERIIELKRKLDNRAEAFEAMREKLKQISSLTSVAFDEVSDMTSGGRAARKLFAQIGKQSQAALALAEKEGT